MPEEMSWRAALRTSSKASVMSSFLLTAYMRRRCTAKNSSSCVMMASAPMAAFMVHPMIALQTEPVWVERRKMVKPFRNT